MYILPSIFVSRNIDGSDISNIELTYDNSKIIGAKVVVLDNEAVDIFVKFYASSTYNENYCIIQYEEYKGYWYLGASNHELSIELKQGSSPNYVVGVNGDAYLENVIDLALGQYTNTPIGSKAFSCAVLTNGEARCWGSDGDATLGNGRLQLIFPIIQK